MGVPAGSPREGTGSGYWSDQSEGDLNSVGGPLLSRANCIHFSQLGHELLRPEVWRGDLVSHEAGDVACESVAVVDRNLPHGGAGLQLPNVRNNAAILRLVQHNPPARRPVLFLQIAIAPTGFGRHRDEMAQHIRRGAVRGRVKARNFAADDLTRIVDAPKNDIGVAIAECVAGAEFDEIGMACAMTSTPSHGLSPTAQLRPHGYGRSTRSPAERASLRFGTPPQ